MTRYEQIKEILISEPRTWLVTGGAGFIGSNLAKELLDLNQKVRVLDDLSTGYRKNIDQVLGTGIRAIDGLLTCGKGQRIGIFGGSGIGKSTLLGMMARYTSADINVIGLVGERGREVRTFIERDLGEEGLKRSVVVTSTSDQPPLLRIRAALVAATIAEYFRDQGKDVLLMMDSITLFMAPRIIVVAPLRSKTIITSMTTSACKGSGSSMHDSSLGTSAARSCKTSGFVSGVVSLNESIEESTS